MLVSAGASEDLIDDISVLEGFYGPKSMFKYLQQQMYPPYYDLPMSQRLNIANNLLYSRWHNIPDLIRMALTPDEQLGMQTLACGKDKGRTLLHSLAKFTASFATASKKDAFSAGELVFDDGFDPSSMSEFIDNQHHNFMYRKLLRELAGAGIPLHEIDQQGRSPFTILFESFAPDLRSSPEFCDPDHFLIQLDSVLRTWLLDLSMAGIDLELYGANEKALQLQYAMTSSSRWLCPEWGLGEDDCPCWPNCSEIFRPIDFSYGPHPEDWRFWFSDIPEDFAGEFWTLIEISSAMLVSEYQSVDLSMPGTWIETVED